VNPDDFSADAAVGSGIADNNSNLESIDPGTERTVKNERLRELANLNGSRKDKDDLSRQCSREANMRPLEDDIREFIHERFPPAEVQSALDLIKDPATSTPRVQRAMLFLANGSLSMLRHYVEFAKTDVREVLIRAEFLTDGSTKHSMRVRNMAEPFCPRQSLVARDVAAVRTANATRPMPPRRVRQRIQQGRFHGALSNQSFQLGDALYVVSPEQQDPHLVRCYRQVGNIVSIVNLPVVFVLELLSEHVDMHDVADAGY
jgi:hypothetical protein